MPAGLHVVDPGLSPVASVVAVLLVTTATLVVGAFGLRLSRTTSDFYVAGRAVTPGWNASAISGEYLSAASFLGVAGLVLTAGTDMLWFPVGYTAGYLVLLVLVAAPLRRSGAYTLPDFAEARLESARVRSAASLLVVGIGWLYLIPQLQGAGLALRAVTGAPRWVGGVVVAVVVLLNVVAGGMRSITFVQAFQYWLKLTAIAVPLFFVLLVWHSQGSPSPAAAASGADWVRPLSGTGGREHPLYGTYSIVLALFFGTMGLPHVLVRFYTNPDGRGARRTTRTVIALLGAFYLFPPVYGALGRVYASDLVASGQADTVVLLLPSRLVPGLGGQLLSALTTAGAFAAFLSTSSGLTMSIAGVLHQDLRRRLTGGARPDTLRGFRSATVVAISVPLALAVSSGSLSLADTVGLAFAVAASTFCPLLVLGIWWRRLSRTGALAGLVAGGGLASAAVLTTMAGLAGDGWGGSLLAQPAAWTVPLAFAVMVVVSLATPDSLPPNVSRTMVRLHTPEDVAVDRR